MTPYIQVVTTVTDQTSAEQLAAVLLEKKLAACIQITPCTSMYRWQGKVEQDVELVCTIKTRRDLFPLLCETIQGHHAYEVPEILAMPVLDGAVNYLEWLKNELAQDPGGNA